MPNFGVLPLSSVLLGVATQTTNGSSANLVIPSASSYRLIVQVNTVSGTLPTLSVALSTSFDNGVTYTQILSSTTSTTTGLGAQVPFRPYLGIGDAATTVAAALVGTANLPGGVATNGPIDPRFIKLSWIIAGTTPSFAFQVGLIAIAQDLSD